MYETLLLQFLATVFIIGISAVLLYRYSTRNHDYWKNRSVPYAKPLPFVGSVLENSRTPLQNLELQRHLKYGPVYGHFEGNRPLLSIGDPVLLREIFVKDFQYFTGRRSISSGDSIVDSFLSNIHGEDWKRVRSIVSPAFSTGKLKRMMNIFKDCSKTVVKNFTKVTDGGKPIEVKRMYGAFTMDIIASSAFSTKIDSHNNPDNTFVKTARAVFTQKFSWRFFMWFLIPGIMKMFKISIISPSVTGFFRDVTLQIIEERKRTGLGRNDFLQLLMDTAMEIEEEEQPNSENKGNEDITENYFSEQTNHRALKNMSNKNLSMDELVAQSVIFFLAGYDTVASTLSFATYLLALHPTVQDKARSEIEKAVQESNGELTYESMQSMKYLDNIISETLRMYPPGIRIERVADADYQLRDTGITIPKGMIITIPVYAIHRDPKIHLEPNKFDPDRFNPKEAAKRDNYAYIPFGAGPRNCVGLRFALLEIKVCLIHVISSFIIKGCTETKVPLEFNVTRGPLQPKEIILEMELRMDSPLVK